MSWNLWSHVRWCGDKGECCCELRWNSVYVCVPLREWEILGEDEDEHAACTPHAHRRRTPACASSWQWHVRVHALEWLMKNSSQVWRVLPCRCLAVPGKLDAVRFHYSCLEWVAISAAFRRGRNTTNCCMKFLRWVLERLPAAPFKQDWAVWRAIPPKCLWHVGAFACLRLVAIYLFFQVACVLIYSLWISVNLSAPSPQPEACILVKSHMQCVREAFCLSNGNPLSVHCFLPNC